MNWGPRSDTMSSGMPKYRNTWLNRFSAVSMAVGRPLRGRRRQLFKVQGFFIYLFENLSTMTRIKVLPLDGGRSVMKSTPKCDHGRVGTGSGRSLPDGRWRGLLEMAQSEHPCTNLTFTHLADTFIQSDLQLHSGYTFSLVSVFPGNRTHNLLCCWRNALTLSHTGTPSHVSGHVRPPEAIFYLLATRGFHWPRGGQCPEMNVPSEWWGYIVMGNVL